MDKAKAAVSDFLHKAGHHDTTVHEHVAPAITNEHITKTHHNETVTAVDREIHQDHHHTTIQPVKDREILPEQHSHNIAGVEHREHHHGNGDAIKARLEEEAARFKNTRTEGQVRETSSVAPTIGGEHIHHHIHETIQPVIQKETIQPSVVHTTVPIHEVHHNEAKHHSASALPAVSMAEFKQQGGVLAGREERFDHFEGEPKGISSHLGNNSHSGTGLTGTHHHHHDITNTSGNVGNSVDPRAESDVGGHRNTSAINSSAPGVATRV